jgi:hypothetical protein
MRKVLLFISIITFAFSVPAFKGLIKFKQNDGMSFSGKLKGDEWFNWIEDEQGDIIKYNQKSKNYEYAIIKEVNGTLDLVPSNIKVGNKPKQSSGLEPTVSGLEKIDKEILKKIWKEKKEKALKYKTD